jgi:predicted AAA+ superfamily ATPase
VRQLIQLHDAALFGKFIKLLAGRVGQLINYSSLAADVGVDAKTVKSWLSILEASFIVFALTPWFENFGKRVIKAPKYYFTEPGLLAWLLDLETPAQASRDPLVGSLFENLVVVEALKARYNRGQAAQLHFFRDSHGNEIDLLYRRGGELTGIEIKAASTWNTGFKKNLLRFSENYRALAHQYVVYNGEPMRFSDGVEAVSFREAGGLA